MSKWKMAVLNDKNIYVMVRTLLEIEVLFYNLESADSEEILGEYIDSNDINIVVVDKSPNNLLSTLKTIKSKKCKVILCDIATDYIFLTDQLKSGLIDNYFEKKDFERIVGIIENFDKESVQTNGKLLLKTDTSFIKVEIKEIHMITYDREKRRSVIHVKGHQARTVKQLKELEEVFTSAYGFVKADRSSIVNTERISEINVENEYLCFDNGQKVVYGRDILREILKKIRDTDVVEA